jgi:very-short-patch-repair endonuclease
MEVLAQETFDRFGYWPQTLSLGSPRKVVHYCEVCGKTKETPYRCFLQGKYTAHPQCKLIKAKQTFIKKYGVDNPQKCKRVRDKTKKTNKKRYGAEYPWQAGSIQQKKRIDCLERHGVESTNQIREVIDKKRQTFLKRYGVSWIPQSKETHKKIREVHLQRWLESCGIQNFEDVYKAALQYIQNEFQKEGYKLLSTSYKNSTTKLNIECPLGHTYSATWDCWKWRKTRCPLCQEGKNERQLGEIVRQIYLGQVVVPQDNLGFLGRQKVDFSVRERKISFEYDGEQHFKPVRFNNVSLKKAKKVLVYVQDLDKQKNALCKKFGYTLIRVKYDEELTLENIKSKIDKEIGNEDCGNS